MFVKVSWQPRGSDRRALAVQPYRQVGRLRPAHHLQPLPGLVASRALTWLRQLAVEVHGHSVLPGDWHSIELGHHLAAAAAGLGRRRVGSRAGRAHHSGSWAQVCQSRWQARELENQQAAQVRMCGQLGTNVLKGQKQTRMLRSRPPRRKVG